MGKELRKSDSGLQEAGDGESETTQKCKADRGL